MITNDQTNNSNDFQNDLVQKETSPVNEYETSLELEHQDEYIDGGTVSDKPNGKGSVLMTFSTISSSIVAILFVAMDFFMKGPDQIECTLNVNNVCSESFDYSLSVNFEYEVENDIAVDFNNFDIGLKMKVSNPAQKIVIPLVPNSNSDVVNVRKMKVTTIKDNVYQVHYDFYGIVDSLEKNTRYEINIIQDENGKISNYTQCEIKTTKEPISTVEKIYYEYCFNEDDDIHFVTRIIDENNIFSNFRYSFYKNLMDDKDMIFEDIKMFNPNGEHIIDDISKYSCNKYRLVVSYDKDVDGVITTESIECLINL